MSVPDAIDVLLGCRERAVANAERCLLMGLHAEAQALYRVVELITDSIATLAKIESQSIQ